MRANEYLERIKQLLETIHGRSITVTYGTGDFDAVNHIYDVAVILGLIQNYVYEGLGLPNPGKPFIINYGGDRK